MNACLSQPEPWLTLQRSESSSWTQLKHRGLYIQSVETLLLNTEQRARKTAISSEMALFVPLRRPCPGFWCVVIAPSWSFSKVFWSPRSYPYRCTCLFDCYSRNSFSTGKIELHRGLCLDGMAFIRICWLLVVPLSIILTCFRIVWWTCHL
jgi:hypothetical protein